MTDETAGIGHNLPPFETISQRTDELIETANKWIAERGEITDEDTAGKAADFLTQLRSEYKAAESERKTEKQPHLDAGKAVDERYKPITTRLTKAADAIKALLTPYQVKKQKAEEEARRKREEDARRAQEEADRLAREAAAKPDIDAQIAAEEAQAKAEAAEKEAAREANANVKGEFGKAVSLRTTYRGEIEDVDAVLLRYRQHPKLLATLQEIVNADIRAGARTIPGVRIVQEQKAA